MGILGTLLVYVGALAAFGKAGFVDAPLLTLIVPIPALGLLMVFAVNGFDLRLRDISGRTLERLLLRATTEYLPSWTIDSFDGSGEAIPELKDYQRMALHRKHFHKDNRPLLREIAIGLTTTEHFYNPTRANTRQWVYLRVYLALTAIFVLTGMVLVMCYGLHQAFANHQAAKWTYWEWALLWLEVAVFITLVVIFFWTVISGEKHRKRAEVAAEVLLWEPPAGPCS